MTEVSRVTSYLVNKTIFVLKIKVIIKHYLIFPRYCLSGPNVGSLSVRFIDADYSGTVLWQLNASLTSNLEWLSGRLPIPPTDLYGMVCSLTVVVC